MAKIDLRQEYMGRIDALRNKLIATDDSFDTALITGKVNLYYLTGTMQDGLLVIKRENTAYFFVRKSYARAVDESPLEFIYEMKSYKDILGVVSPNLGKTYLETELVPIAMLTRLQKYFTMDSVKSIDSVITMLRSVKSEYEISIIRKCGQLHKQLMEDIIPELFLEGMTEAELQAAINFVMIKQGYQGVTRFSMFQIEAIIGQVGFGDNSAYPTSFNGPDGMRGMGAYSPAIGSNTRKLQAGDLVMIDIGYGYHGYHTDKTMIYSFGSQPDQGILDIQRACMAVEKKAVDMLTAGAIPADIYQSVMDDLPPELSSGFMGTEAVSFLGHGVGLYVDEFPVIARGFDMPLEENMVIAIEPKCAVAGQGTVGTEDTYLVTKGRAESLTGGGQGILIV